MQIFDFTDYKEIVKKVFELRPRRGHGQYRKLAQTLRLSSVAVSQIFKGSRDLSPEQALDTARFLFLGPEETEYFLLLVQRARAGTKELQTHFDRKIEKARAEREVLAKRVQSSAEMSESAKAIFYSNWQYSAVRIASSIPALGTAEALARRLDLDEAEVEGVLRFLLEQNLCVSTPEGIRMGAQSTMLPADSPYINNHRRNWRLKGLEHLRRLGPQDLFYSGVVSLSAEDIKEFRKELVELIARFVARVKDSPSERLACMNLDWFEVRK